MTSTRGARAPAILAAALVATAAAASGAGAGTGRAFPIAPEGYEASLAASSPGRGIALRCDGRAPGAATSRCATADGAITVVAAIGADGIARVVVESTQRGDPDALDAVLGAVEDAVSARVEEPGLPQAAARTLGRAASDEDAMGIVHEAETPNARIACSAPRPHAAWRVHCELEPPYADARTAARGSAGR